MGWTRHGQPFRLAAEKTATTQCDKMRKLIKAGMILVPLLAYTAVSNASDSYQKMHNEHHNEGHGHDDAHNQGHHNDEHMQQAGKHKKHHQHDEVTMPGLRGIDTTQVEISDLKNIFTNHMKINRRVEQLPNGIKTITETDDDDLRESIVTHVALMVTRLEEGRNPQVIIQSPTLDLLFDRYDEIETNVEITNRGVQVIQTSSNRDVVALLQQHAAEVSDMSKRGMRAVHERMMKSH